MIRLNQIKVPITHSEKELRDKIIKTLKLNKNTSFKYRILKKSIDARKKPELYYVYSLGVKISNEAKIVSKLKSQNISIAKEKHYSIPAHGELSLHKRPVIIGAGPAGLFAALVLAEAGFAPLVIERGKTIENRTEDVNTFWKTGILNPASNVQFGEGGAGTFSDGKLNTAVKDSSGRNTFVLETFVRFGASENILYDNKPHIGTDILSQVIVNMREYIKELGGDFIFEACVDRFDIKDNKLTSIYAKGIKYDTQAVILAPGHSARDTFNILYEQKVPMEVKNFAVGFRVEHPQKMIDKAMYGSDKVDLPASPYKVTSNFPNGRGVYSFCMCPGGYVVNSSSEEGATVVNGMSYSGRDGANANSAIIVSVSPKDFGADDALAGMRFQQMLEKKNYQLANGKIPQQLFGDYCQNIESKAYGDFESTTKGQRVLSNLRGLMNPEMEDSFIQGMQHFGHIVPNFDRRDVILSGMETRTSSPLRIIRNEYFESIVEGLYPCGEGAGFAGGITSAAMDGIKVAEAIIRKYHPKY